MKKYLTSRKKTLRNSKKEQRKMLLLSLHEKPDLSASTSADVPSGLIRRDRM